MTTTAIADYILIAWDVGYGWGAWHVEVAPGESRCGMKHAALENDHTARKHVSSLNGVADLCGTCSKHTPPRGVPIDISAALHPESIGALLAQAGLTIITASPVGVIAQCAADPRGIRLHRTVLQPHNGAWRGSYAVALPNRRLGQPRVHHVVSRHAVVHNALELVLWLFDSERAAQQWVG